MASQQPPASRSLSHSQRFDEVAMLPQEGDSAAVAKDLLPLGTRIALPVQQERAQVPGSSSGNNNNNRAVTIELSAPCLEGHRFALRSLRPGDALLSWGLPFGHAVVPIRPGDVLLNRKTAATLRGRLSGPHGAENAAIRTLLQRQAVNFEDLDVSPDSPFLLDENGFTAVGRNKCNCKGKGTAPKQTTTTTTATKTTTNGTFLGYQRPWGVTGTRNHVLVIGLTASAMPLLAPLKTRWRQYETSSRDDNNNNNSNDNNSYSNFDGVRIVAHTEGESHTPEQHNRHKLHRCLAGWICHANAGAVVVVTTGRERHVTTQTLLEFARQHRHRHQQQSYPPECFQEPHLRFVELKGDGGSGNGSSNSFLEPLDRAVRAAVHHATARYPQREPRPLSELCIALQCGGSDSFSGLTGNPLTGQVAARFITDHGSRAILAESPELVGAEPYILSRVASEDTARRFIATTEAYKAYGARHGLSVAGNPSGGNLYRGLYNIVLKSLGAARKKPPSIALDCVLEYGEPMDCGGSSSSSDGSDGPNFYAFMDSPGNDLESIAGQVACGCNLIIFITGNGAMTNFPFVPTIKVVTTEKRYKILEHDMDVNAAPYGHGGEDAERAVDDMFRLCVRVCSGERSKGEAKGHSQVSVWRNWAVENRDDPDRDTTDCLPGESHHRQDLSNKLQLCSHVEPHEIRPDPPPLSAALLEERPVERVASNDINSVLRPWKTGSTFALIPTSLCSSGVADNIKDFISSPDINHIACPNHTEGCGAAGDAVYERRYQRLMLGHALHPSVGRALFLEHGCEKTHNDYFRNVLAESGALTIEESSELASIFGFWSLQGDGGFDNAKRHIMEYFVESPPRFLPSPPAKLFGVPWSSRPISVGLLVDPVMATADGQIVGPALAAVVRFLSQLHVHSVLPVNSPLISSFSSNLIPHDDKQHRNQIPSSVTTDVDMEDLYAPPRQSEAPIAHVPEQGATVPLNRHAASMNQHQMPLSTLFVVEALVDATLPLNPTLLPGQMVNQRRERHDERGGLHVMDLPRGATWDEMVSCLSPACDLLLLVADPSQLAFLPGSCLTPTLRRGTPPCEKDDDDEEKQALLWHQWTDNTCAELLKVLRSPLVVGGSTDRPMYYAPEELESLQKSLFSLTTFVVPRGHAVSF